MSDLLERARALETRWEPLGPLVSSTLPSFGTVYTVLERHLAAAGDAG